LHATHFRACVHYTDIAVMRLQCFCNQPLRQLKGQYLRIDAWRRCQCCMLSQIYINNKSGMCGGSNEQPTCKRVPQLWHGAQGKGLLLPCPRAYVVQKGQHQTAPCQQRPCLLLWVLLPAQLFPVPRPCCCLQQLGLTQGSLAPCLRPFHWLLCCHVVKIKA